MNVFGGASITKGYTGPCILLVAGLTLGALSNAWGQSSYSIQSTAPGKVMPGNIAFVDTVGKRIVEIDRAGAVVWDWPIPASVIGKGDLSAAADLEWIRNDDSFLLTVPFRGIFRVNRDGKVIWRNLTSKVSHDADLLPNGNVIYVNGWDSPSDAQVTEVDPRGNTVWSWRAKGVVDDSWRRTVKGEPRTSFAHTNAVVRLSDGDTMVSLRNFDRVFRIGANDAIERIWGPITRVHEPNLLPDGTLIASKHARDGHSVISESPNGRQRTIFDKSLNIRPIRTVEVLDNGNLLLTGGEEIVEVNNAGRVVWHVAISPKTDKDGGRGDRRSGKKRSRDAGERGIYKAVWVGR